MVVHNMMEDAASDLLSRHWVHFQVACHCDACREDVLALSLNKLKPKYVRYPAGSMYAKADLMTEQSAATILTALVESAKVVSAHPHHHVN